MVSPTLAPQDVEDMASSPLDTNCSEQAIEQSDVVANDAKMLLSEAPEYDRDRTAEFEEQTARERQTHGENVEAMTTQGTNGEGLPHSSPEHEPHITSQERGLYAHNAREEMVEPKREATPLSPQAAWVTEAVIACQANKKVRS